MRHILTIYQKQKLLEMFQVTSIKLTNKTLNPFCKCIATAVCVKRADVMLCPHFAVLLSFVFGRARCTGIIIVRNTL